MNHKNKAINFVFGLLAIGFWFAPLIRAEVQVTDNVIVVVDASGNLYVWGMKGGTFHSTITLASKRTPFTVVLGPCANN